MGGFLNGREVSSVENETVRAPCRRTRSKAAAPMRLMSGLGFSGVVGLWGTFDDVGPEGMGRGRRGWTRGKRRTERGCFNVGTCQEVGYGNLHGCPVDLGVGLLQPRQPEDDLRRRMELSDEEIESA